MWIAFAFGSALFAGITSILAKIGIKDTDSTVATAVRTVIILFFSWLIVFITGAFEGIGNISAKTLLFLILSGLATGGSWLCYFKALCLGDVNKVTPIDKSSTVLTMLLAFVILGESLNPKKLTAIVLIGAGTFLMITKKQSDKEASGKGWFFYAALSAVFASLTSILGKIGISGVDSNLGTAIRTIVVLIMAWLMVFVTGKQGEIKKIGRKRMAFICLSGITTGMSWLCYYKALQDGQASVVVPIDKLSILVTIAFSGLVLKESLTKKAALGLIMITAGTLFTVIA
ncbi:MAG: EamA family transporter [Huintestinicola sp.]